MRSPSPAAWIRRALPTRRRALASTAVGVVLLAVAEPDRRYCATWIET
ncbi:hypothetical protein [Salinispora arenicola]|nr:hypothetical protein [Salinispora arenicola]